MSDVDRLHRWLLGNDYRRVDALMFWIELIVLVLVAVEVGLSIWDKVQHSRQHRKQKSRALEKEERLNKALAFAATGEKLAKRVPSLEGTESSSNEWNGNVNEWHADVHRFLTKCSGQAVAKFLDDSHVVGVSFPGIAKPCENALLSLKHRQKNLEAIIANPEFYF